MTAGMVQAWRQGLAALCGAAALALCAPVAAQVQQVDPDKAIDADLANGKSGAPQAPDSRSTPAPAPAPAPAAAPAPAQGPASAGPASDVVVTAENGGGKTRDVAPNVATTDKTYRAGDLVKAGEEVFGEGAAGLAEMIQGLLKKQGEPNAYIQGSEGGAALIVGLRYGKGTLTHKVEGQKPVYWTGPSVGIDAGGNAAKAFVLVYNLYDTEDLYKRFPAGEGQAYVVGGLTASYLRSGDVVLIPIRMGVGMRLGINAGYMKFSKKQKWLPF
ncbi:MAG TPA: DUF1134 domain-containing protein [Novosphingobium sp.]|nr:DUF1134 domain-containing protein [Novosphingobium sp.]